LKNTNLVRVSVLGGFVGQNTNYRQNNVPQNLASALIATDLQFFRFNKTNASVTIFLLPIISGPARAKFNMNASYYLKLTGNLSWTARFTATGTAGLRMALRAATTGPPLDATGHLGTSDRSLARNQERGATRPHLRARCGAPGVTNGFARMNTFRIARYSEQPHEAQMISMRTDSFASGDFWNAPSEF
jgi:hypothetical protein